MNNKKMRLLLVIQILCLILTILIVAGVVFFLTRHQQTSKVLNAYEQRVELIEKQHQEIEKKVNNVEKSYSPIKGVDYFDGKDGSNGKDGKDSISTHTIEKQPVKGKDGLTPDLRCNEEKNRWEIRYNLEDTWKVLQGKSTRCTISLDMQQSIDVLKK